MSKNYFFVNILVYWVVITSINVAQIGSFGQISALLFGGILFAFASLIVDPILSFFKFPSNIWGVLFVGFLVNMAFFAFFSSGLLPSLLVFETGRFGSELTPLNFFNLSILLNTKFISSLFTAFVATLLQILVRRLSS